MRRLSTGSSRFHFPFPFLPISTVLTASSTRSYILSMCINDHTSQIWVSGFNEVGADIFGRSADEMQALKEEDDALFQKAVSSACAKTYNFNIKARADTFGDQTRVRYQINRMGKVEWGKAAKELAELIEKW
jgi:replication factor A1